MLGAEQADTFGAERASNLCIFRVVSIGADSHCAELLNEFHKSFVARIFASINHRDWAIVDKTLAAVQADDFAFFQSQIAHMHHFVGEVNV